MSIREQIETLKPLIQHLNYSGQTFANSLINQWERKRRLSQLQQLSIDSLILDARKARDTPKPEPERVDLHANVQPLYDLFQRARENKIQMPKIKTHLESGANFTLSLSSTGEFVYLKLGDTYYGKVSRDGQLMIHPRVPRCEEIHTLVKDIGENPSKVGKIHGQKWDNCMFCGRGLQTKDSVFYGYGPICAEKWGLEWGIARERIAEQKEAVQMGAIESALKDWNKQ